MSFSTLMSRICSYTAFHDRKPYNDFAMVDRLKCLTLLDIFFFFSFLHSLYHFKVSYVHFTLLFCTVSLWNMYACRARYRLSWEFSTFRWIQWMNTLYFVLRDQNFKAFRFISISRFFSFSNILAKIACSFRALYDSLSARWYRILSNLNVIRLSLSLLLVS